MSMSEEAVLRAHVRALRERVLEVLPWYDELNPDYTELDRVLAEALSKPAPESGLRDAVKRYVVAVTRLGAGHASEDQVQAAYAAMVDALSAGG
jgi:hypothetical protein